MEILDLPNELLLLIADDLLVKDLYRFLSTCHRLSSLLTPYFHKLALQEVGSLTALQWAAMHGHASLADLVLSKGAGGEVGSDKRDPLHLAAEYNRPDVIRVLEKHGKQTTGRTSGVSTPLHMAAHQGSVHAIRVLLELGADMASKDRGGRTPAHISATKGDINSMRAFIDAGLDFSLQNGLGQTVLHEASLNWKEKMVKFLLGHEVGGIINARDSTGRTPLHCAVFGTMVSVEIVQLLCRHGADTEVADDMGNTPVDLALDHCGFSLNGMLEERMANVSDRECICRA